MWRGGEVEEKWWWPYPWEGLCLKEVQDIFYSFLSIENVLEPLGYSGSLPKKAHRLVQVVIDKDGALTKANWSLEVAQNKTKEFEKALKESQDDHQKTKRSALPTCVKKIFLFVNNHLQSLYRKSSLYPERALKMHSKIWTFLLTSLISRTQVRLNQMIVDEEMVILDK